jgi:hypothetical protein
MTGISPLPAGPATSPMKRIQAAPRPGCTAFPIRHFVTPRRNAETVRARDHQPWRSIASRPNAFAGIPMPTGRTICANVRRPTGTSTGPAFPMPSITRAGDMRKKAPTNPVNHQASRRGRKGAGAAWCARMANACPPSEDIPQPFWSRGSPELPALPGNTICGAVREPIGSMVIRSRSGDIERARAGIQRANRPRRFAVFHAARRRAANGEPRSFRCSR